MFGYDIYEVDTWYLKDSLCSSYWFYTLPLQRGSEDIDIYH